MPAGLETASRDYRVTMMFHPSHDVLDLDEAEAWYARVFGRPSTSLASVFHKLPHPPGSGYPPDYSTFTLIADVLLDTIDPKRYVFDGVQRMASVEQPHLRLMSWYADPMNALLGALKRQGFAAADQMGRLIAGDTAPTAGSSPIPIFYTVPAETGLRYSFFSAGAVNAVDPRLEPGWTLPPPSSDDPLGIVCCSHHTVLTDQPERALRLLRDVLDGTVVHHGREPVRGTTSTYVSLAGSTIELAVPDAKTPAHADWTRGAPDDTYHALTWLVSDLGRVERHLTAEGVRIAARSNDMFVTDPETSLGIPWGFTTSLVPGDPRRGAKG